MVDHGPRTRHCAKLRQAAAFCRIRVLVAFVNQAQLFGVAGAGPVMRLQSLESLVGSAHQAGGLDAYSVAGSATRVSACIRTTSRVSEQAIQSWQAQTRDVPTGTGPGLLERHLRAHPSGFA